MFKMSKKILKGTAVFAAAAVMLSSCGTEERSDGENESGSAALTWVSWGGYDNFWALLNETYPDIEIESIAYAGANYTGYSWAQMRGDDISDLFSTSQILDRELAKERLLDLSGYDFMNDISTSVLDQVSVDGGVYLLPVNNAMYGILYNKTLMEEHGWELPQNFDELEKLCAEIKAEGLIPGIIGTQLTGNTFSAVFNLAKTDWLTTPEGIKWERDFLAGGASAKGTWESTVDYVQRYIDIGMYTADPEDRSNVELIKEYMSERKAVFFTMAALVDDTVMSSGDEWGMMPYIGEDGSKNIYMYNPTSYIGISKRLAEPGNEEKLEKAVRVLSLIFSDEGQSSFVNGTNPCVMDVLSSTDLPEDSMIYDSQQAIRRGRAFPMTYANWENVLADMGQAFKEWIRAENEMNGVKCIDRMDELQSAYLNNKESLYFCESTADHTLEETARLVGGILGRSAGTDAAIIPYGTALKDGKKLSGGITGKLYKGGINADVANTIAPGGDGEYTVMTMTGAEAKALAEKGFDLFGNGEPFPYVLVTKGGKELDDNTSYSVAFISGSCTEEVGQEYNAVTEKGSVRSFIRERLTELKTVSPDKIIWE